MAYPDHIQLHVDRHFAANLASKLCSTRIRDLCRRESIPHHMAKKSQSTAGKLTLIVSDQKNPQVVLKPGTKLEVASIKLADPSLKALRPVAARLCGGTSTCLALVETGPTRGEK
jgi:hypothetical protein